VNAGRLPAIVGASAVAVIGAIVVSSVRLEPLSLHMAVHIALMNVVAPLAGAVLSGKIRAPGASRVFWIAATAQIVLLWIWHAPALHRAVLHSESLQFLMHGSLLIVAVIFWTLLSRLPPRAPWQAIAALLLTGKLACLLAALFIFAPTALYAAGTHHGAPVTLSDQQFAGLLMITACPLSYVLAAVVFAAQALGSSQAIDRVATRTSVD
jgi:putative membrane protein